MPSLFACSVTESGGGNVGVTRATLRRARDCGDLLAMVKDDARAKMNARIDAQIAALRDAGFFFAQAKDAGTGGIPPTPSAPPADGAKDYSQTNVQVQGVDEADIAKTDGKRIYLVHGQSFVVLDAWPAATLAQASSFAIEGHPSEMFVTEGQAVIFSTVDGTALYEEAGLPPRSTYDDRVYYGVAGAPYGGPGWYASPLTKITQVTMDESGQPTLARELYFEGTYVSSRRVGTRVRAIVGGSAHGPALRYYPDASPGDADAWIAALEQLRASNAAAIDASTITDWIPYAMARTEAGLTATPAACGDVYVPTSETTQYGLTQVASIDLAAPDEPPTDTTIVGAVDTVYQSAGTMVLASRGWTDPGIAIAAAAPPSMPVAPRALNADGTATLTFTHLHALDLTADPAKPAYVGSGTVPGAIDDQFSIDEKGGDLRVATTEQRWSKAGSTTSSNHLFVLRPAAGALSTIGDAGTIAAGEQIYAVRFVGDRGYVVTFRRVDPLFVFDLSNPAAPHAIGEVTIPGFSTYMHPLDDGHLLTIGQDATPDGHVLGLALQIFDVTDGAAPKLASKYSFSGADYGYSDAAYDHKAFTYFADRALLAFPFVAYGQEQMRSSCEVFRASVAGGIQKLGSVDHTDLFAGSPQGFCGGYFGPYVRRGIFLEDVLYSISYGGVVASDVNDLSQPIAVVPLDQPADEGVPGCMAP